VAPKSAGDLNGGGRHTATHIEHLLTRLEPGELAHLGSRAAAAWVDYPLADKGSSRHPLCGKQTISSIAEP